MAYRGPVGRAAAQPPIAPHTRIDEAGALHHLSRGPQA